ncbi:MAG: hypothetical protein JXA78_01825 [Anaerolineales bacterium]|nr:hypothetical protein [Anaerolineales bacterium]
MRSFAVRSRIGWLLALALLGAPAYAGNAAEVIGQGGNRVGLVVQFESGSIEAYCIAFEEESLSGFEILQRSGLEVIADFSGAGAAVCKIETFGCPVDRCLDCQLPSYWSYWHLEEGNWVYSQLGASLSQAHHGDVEGWRWGPGQPPEQVISFEEICTAATDTPTPSSTPTRTKKPASANPPTASHTPTHTQTSTPTHTPTPTATNAPAQALSPTSTLQPSPTTTATRLATSTSTPTSTPRATTPAPSQTPTPSPSPSLTVTPTPGATQTPTLEANIQAFSADNKTPAAQKRQPEASVTPTQRQGFQKSQSTALALALASPEAGEPPAAPTRPNLSRIALLGGGLIGSLIGYLVFMLLLGSLSLGLVLVWSLRRK